MNVELILDETSTRIRQLMLDKFEIQEIELTDDARFKEDLNIDSLDVMEFQLALEKMFNIVIPQEDADKLQTVGSVIKYVGSTQI